MKLHILPRPELPCLRLSRRQVPESSRDLGRQSAQHRSQRFALEGVVKTALLMSGLALLAALVGLLIFGWLGVLLAVSSVVVLAVVGMRAPTAWVMRLQGALPLPYWQAPGLHRLVARLAARAGVPTPTLHIIQSPAANAMTAGGGSQPGALAITQGALALLDADELETVLAHEVAHLRARDASIQQVAGWVSSSVTALLEVAIWTALLGALLGGVGVGRMLLMLALAFTVPVVITLLRAALSRTREFAADHAAALLTGKPLALARALRKLSLQSRTWFGGWLSTASQPPLLRSHPSTEERIRRLFSLAPESSSVVPRFFPREGRPSRMAWRPVPAPWSLHRITVGVR